ncbi:hypothetical protein, partial [Mycobacterium tuberculosis]|uniref:hypothetical protein n=1 Tax=Mycobacterium tuberculosis TaxID=1773 RepID=UPI002236815E
GAADAAASAVGAVAPGQARGASGTGDARPPDTAMTAVAEQAGITAPAARLSGSPGPAVTAVA